MCLQKFPPWFADYLKSATGQLPKLPTCACRNSPPPWFADFLKSATGQLPRLPSWSLPVDSHLSYLHKLVEMPPSLQIFWNLPLDSYLCFLHVLAEIASSQFAYFLKSATGQLPRFLSWNLPMDSYISYLHVLAEIPPVCRFSEICHWTVT